MNRPLRLTLAALLAVVALLAFRVALDGTTTNYLLPAPNGTTTKHSAVFAPGVAAAALAGLVAVGTLGWVVVNVVRRPTPRAWWLVVGLVVVDIVVLAVVGELPHPAF